MTLGRSGNSPMGSSDPTLGHACERLLVLAQQFCRFSVQGIVRIGIVKEQLQAKQEMLYPENGLPIGSQDVEADVSIRVDVRMIDGGVAVDFRGIHGIAERNSDAKVELAAFPVSLLWRHPHPE